MIWRHNDLAEYNGDVYAIREPSEKGVFLLGNRERRWIAVGGPQWSQIRHIGPWGCPAHRAHPLFHPKAEQQPCRNNLHTLFP